MILRPLGSVVRIAVLIAIVSFPAVASAKVIRGNSESISDTGQVMELTMTIDDTKTRFEMTGPDYSWFAFGFDTDTMMGYSLIVEGLDDSRTAVEQNLVGIGNPGGPQETQNINIVDTIHHAVDNLTTIVVERPNTTSDSNDPVFTTSMTSLPIIWAHDSFATPAAPNPDLTYHGRGGRGFNTITFVEVPEPASLLLAAMAALALYSPRRRQPPLTA
jgi:hypothetical protein